MKIVILFLSFFSLAVFSQVHDNTCRATGQLCSRMVTEFLVEKKFQHQRDEEPFSSVVEATHFELALHCGDRISTQKIEVSDFTTEGLVEQFDQLKVPDHCRQNHIEIHGFYTVAGQRPIFTKKYTVSQLPFTHGQPFSHYRQPESRDYLVREFLKALPLTVPVTGTKVKEFYYLYQDHKGYFEHTETGRVLSQFHSQRCVRHDLHVVPVLPQTVFKDHFLEQVILAGDYREKVELVSLKKCK